MQADEIRPPKVVYIAGPGRSGSTVLERALGQAEGWFPCGELNLVWWDQECGCGAQVFACDFWKPVLDEALARHPRLNRAALIELNAPTKKLLANPGTLAAIAGERRRKRPSRIGDYAALLADLYATAARAAGASVLIDSSKTAADPYLIATLTGVELYVVHLVRDPRGVAYSWSKRKAKSNLPLRYFGRMGPFKSSLHWLRRNATIETLVRRRLGDRYLLVRYEDFARRPEAIARSICSLVGEPDAGLPFTDDSTVRLGANHTVSGNPARFGTGERRIRLDEEWRARMAPGARIVATFAAAPLMRRYGYRLRVTR